MRRAAHVGGHVLLHTPVCLDSIDSYCLEGAGVQLPPSPGRPSARYGALRLPQPAVLDQAPAGRRPPGAAAYEARCTRQIPLKGPEAHDDATGLPLELLARVLGISHP